MIFSTAAVLMLSGCEVPVMIAAENNDAQLTGLTTITFPAKMLITVDDQPEVLYSGKMLGRMSGAADIEMATADGSQCKGAMNPGGTGQMTCDGVTFPLTREEGEKTSMSGMVYRTGQVAGTGYETAFGWGKGANETALRVTLQQERSLTAREARSLSESAGEG